MSKKIEYIYGEEQDAETFCIICDGAQWVCENHPRTPWDGSQMCCEGAGMPCECSGIHPSIRHHGKV